MESILRLIKNLNYHMEIIKLLLKQKVIDISALIIFKSNLFHNIEK